MNQTKRQELETSVNEKLISMVQTNDLDNIYSFFADVSKNLLTKKQLEILNLAIDKYEFTSTH